MPLRGGQTFAGYRIVRLLGSGGMGEVYLAQHPRLPRRDALKLLPRDWAADIEYRERFSREADLASTLWHPHIVGVHDRGEEDGQLWISMDYVDGLDAARLLTDRYPDGMPVEDVARVITSVASALDYAHKQGLLHRDIKPANVMVTHLDDEAEQRVLLADFGIARKMDDISGITKTNMTVGTVAYSAPEQLLGEEIDGRADQYSLAATAFHLLTGSQLFPHSNPLVVSNRHLNVAPPSLADRRPDLAYLDRILAIGLAKRPEDRFKRCAEFARALADELPGSRTASPSAATQAAPRPGRAATKSTPSPANKSATRSRRTWLVAGGIVATIFLSGAIALAFTRRDDRQPDSNAITTTKTTQRPSSTGSPMPPGSPAVQTPAPTTDPKPGDPDYMADPRFRYGVAGPHDIRFAYGVAPGEPCGNEPQQFAYTTEATFGSVATCLSPNGNGHGTWVLVGSWGSFDGVHSRGSLCDAGGTAMSLDGRQMLCVIGADGTGTWQYGS